MRASDHTMLCRYLKLELGASVFNDRQPQYSFQKSTSSGKNHKIHYCSLANTDLDGPYCPRPPQSSSTTDTGSLTKSKSFARSPRLAARQKNGHDDALQRYRHQWGQDCSGPIVSPFVNRFVVPHVLCQWDLFSAPLSSSRRTLAQNTDSFTVSGGLVVYATSAHEAHARVEPCFARGHDWPLAAVDEQRACHIRAPCR